VTVAVAGNQTIVGVGVLLGSGVSIEVEAIVFCVAMDVQLDSPQMKMTIRNPFIKRVISLVYYEIIGTKWFLVVK